MNKVNFICMEDGTAEEYVFLDNLENQYKADLPSRLINALEKLRVASQDIKLVDLSIPCRVQLELI